MAELIGALRGELSLSAAQFEQDIKAARSALRREAAGMEQSMASFQSRVDSTVKSLGNIGIIAAGAVVGMLAFTRQAMASAASLHDISKRIDVTTDDLQKLRYAAEMNGAAVGVVDTALRRFARRIGDASAEAGALRKVLGEYGIAARDAGGNTRSTIDVLRDLSDAMSRAESHQEKMRIAFVAFDTEGAQLVPLLQQGAAALDRWGTEAEEMGLVLDAEIIAKSAEAHSKLDRMDRVLKANAQTLALQLVPVMEDFATVMTSPQLIEGMQTIGNMLVALTKAAAENAAAAGALTGAWLGFRITPGPPLLKLGGALALGITGYRMMTPEADRLSAALMRQSAEVDRLTALWQGANTPEIAKLYHDDMMQAIAIRQETIRELEELERRAAEAFQFPVSPPVDPYERLPPRDLPGEKEAKRIAERLAREEEARRESLSRQLDQIRQHLMSEEELQRMHHALRLETLREGLDAEILTRGEYHQLKMELELQALQKQWEEEKKELERQRAEERRLEEERLQGVRRTEDAIRAQKMQTAALTVDLLNMVGGKSRAAAVAAILLQKGVAAANVVLSTTQAAAAALAPPPLGLGPVAGQALAAKIKMWGGVQLGLIAATTIGQIASGAGAASMGGGGGGGAYQEAMAPASAASVINLHISRGNRSSKLWTEEEITELLGALGDRIADGARLGTIRFT